MTIPSDLILSSDVGQTSAAKTTTTSQNGQFLLHVRQWMESQLQDSFSNTVSFLPEFVLAFRILYEMYLEDESCWYDWIQALPTTFSTGLYLDSIERSYVERSSRAKRFLNAQQTQFSAFHTTIENILLFDEQTSILPSEFSRWLSSTKDQPPNKYYSSVGGFNSQDNQRPQTKFDELVRWAFTVVFTRSWRTPDGTESTIVPLGDLINHNSQLANLRPYVRPSDDALQLCLTEDVDFIDNIDASSASSSGMSVGTTSLYLSYGATYVPARFLVVFGFCDTSAAYVDAHVDFIDTSILKSVGSQDSSPILQLLLTSIFDPTTMVVSTSTGAVTEEVWLAFLYQVLQEDFPDTLQKLEHQFSIDSHENNNDDLIDEKLLEALDDLLWEHELKVAAKMRHHYQQLLQTDYEEISTTDQDLLQHHPNLIMISNYYTFMRETFLQVIRFIDDYTEQAKEIKNIKGR